jgi:hypothetical protein
VPSPFKLAVAAAERVLDRELGDYSPVRSIVEQVVRAIDDAYLHAERELVSALADGTGEVDTVRDAMHGTTAEYLVVAAVDGRVLPPGSNREEGYWVRLHFADDDVMERSCNPRIGFNPEQARTHADGLARTAAEKGVRGDVVRRWVWFTPDEVLASYIPLGVQQPAGGYPGDAHPSTMREHDKMQPNEERRAGVEGNPDPRREEQPAPDAQPAEDDGQAQDDEPGDEPNQ